MRNRRQQCPRVTDGKDDRFRRHGELPRFDNLDHAASTITSSARSSTTGRILGTQRRFEQTESVLQVLQQTENLCPVHRNVIFERAQGPDSSRTENFRLHAYRQRAMAIRCVPLSGLKTHADNGKTRSDGKPTLSSAVECRVLPYLPTELAEYGGVVRGHPSISGRRVGRGLSDA